MPAPQRRAARLPAGALQALPSVSLPDDSSTSTLVLFVLLVVVINTGLLHTVLWGLFLVRGAVPAGGPTRVCALTRSVACAQAAVVISCLRVLVLVALMQTAAAAASAAAEAGGGDVELGEGGASGAGADGRVNPVLLQMQLLSRELTERDYTALLALDDNGGGGAPRRGVPRAALELIPTHAFRADGTTAADAGGGGGSTCAVCLEEPADGDELRTLPCLHQVRPWHSVRRRTRVR